MFIITPKPGFTSHHIASILDPNLSLDRFIGGDFITIDDLSQEIMKSLETVAWIHKK